MQIATTSPTSTVRHLRSVLLFAVLLFAVLVLSVSNAARAQSPVSEITDSNGNTLMTLFDNGNLDLTGTLDVNRINGFVGVNRTSPIVGSEAFGVRTEVAGNALGGMFVETSSSNGNPFYGYSTDGEIDAYHYFDGDATRWVMHVDGSNRLTVQANGNVGIGTMSPPNALTVSGTIESTSGGILLPDGTVIDESGDLGGGGLSLPFSGSASSSDPAFSIANTGTGDGINISGAGEDGIQIQNATYGLFAFSPAEDGLLISGAGENGLDIEDAGSAGIQVTGSGIAAQLTGDSTSVLEIRNQGGNDGIQILQANDDGMQVQNVSYGVFADEVSEDGLIVREAGDDGVDVEGADHGIIAEGDTDADGQGYAGRFLGDVDVSGSVNANAKNFKIDHPQDPTGKYLKHTSIESRNRLNVYTGNVTLDGNGEATVTLPDYVETINRDYRYQLTAIGGAAPRLHIAAEIENNAFRIAGGKAGMKVSWRVTGIRDDAWARQHPFQDEVQKPAAKQGTYRHPEAYDVSKSQSESSVEQEQKQNLRPTERKHTQTQPEKEYERQNQ
jgi:hypothetical protein